MSKKDSTISCPVCDRNFSPESIEDHVNKCIFLHAQVQSESKRDASHLESNLSQEKRFKRDHQIDKETSLEATPKAKVKTKEPITSKSMKTSSDSVPLAERMRPAILEELVGQGTAFGSGSMLRLMLEQKKIPNMILWGPPGCGKTSLANVVANICKGETHLRFVKLSATMAGINDIKEVVKVAKNEMQFKRQTVLFMDEIHRFNKLQQDSFLPHVESGCLVLVGATTENPSFSLNSALLSRCRVVVMDKLGADDVISILERAVAACGRVRLVDDEKAEVQDSGASHVIPRAALRWLAGVCDGDARAALGALELALAAHPAPRPAPAGTPAPPPVGTPAPPPVVITLEDFKSGIQRSHTLYDRAGEQHHNTVSALHKAVRAGADSAALYWLCRALAGGEDPLYLARRLVRAASEDVGLAEPGALVEAVACLEGCARLGRPECDVLLAQCAVRLARAPKSREVHDALAACTRHVAAGPLPPVPLHLRNAPTDLMKRLGYGKGYNMSHQDVSGLSYMPEGAEHLHFFTRQPDDGRSTRDHDGD